MKYKLFLMAMLLPLCAIAQTSEKKIVAYVTSWSSVTPDPKVMTHINYAFGGVGGDGQSVYADNTTRMQQIVKLKSRNPKLKVLLSIGGWGRGNFSPMAKDAAKREAFAKSCRTFCEKYNLDGIDIDWEFPGNNSSGESSPSGEKQSYNLLMRDLRAALGDELLLTMAASSDPGYYDFKGCIQYLDFVNVMTYDMSGPPNHHSALYRGGKVGNGWLVMSESIQKHLNAGIPASKLVMGLAFYGNSGQGSQISLQEIKDGIASGKWADHWDDTAKVPYVTDKDGKFAYGYDDDRSLTIKCQYIMKQKLAGGMYWEYANDDKEGTERKTVYDCLIGTQRKGLRFGDNELTYSGSNTYSADMELTTGTIYYATGADEMTAENWYSDPDFFLRLDDGGYRFLPLSGRYRVAADFFNRYFRVTPLDKEGRALTYNPTDGTGCIWVLGANSSVGKPLYDEGTDTAWDEEKAMAMAPVGKNKFQITLEVGRQLNPGMVNFKFFHQNGFGSGGEFTARGTYRINTYSRLFQIMNTTTEKGNIHLRNGVSIAEGQAYIFTIDTTDPSKALLTVEDAETGQIQILDNNSITAPMFDLQGRKILRPTPGHIYITPERKKVLR